MSYQEYLTIRDRVAFNQGPYVATPVWTDITNPGGLNDNAVRPGGTFATGRQTRGGGPEGTSVTLNVGNRDGRYTPYFSGSPYYPLTEASPYIRDVEYPKGSGTWYPVWAGVMSDCQADFEGAHQGTAQLSFQQRLALTSNKPLRAIAVGQISNTAPLHFWPFDDPAGSLQAADARGITYPPMRFDYAGDTGSGGLLEFGTGFAPGDEGGTRLALTPTVTTGASAEGFGYRGTCEFTAITSNAAQVEIVVSCTQTANRTQDVLSFFDSANNVDILVTTDSSEVVVYQGDAVGETWTMKIHYPPGLGDGEDHALGLTVFVVGTTATARVYVDGTQIGNWTYTASNGLASFDRVRITGRNYALSGTVANLAVWDTIDTARRQIYTDSVVGFEADTADVRFARLADVGGARLSTGSSVWTLALSDWITTQGTFTRLIGAQQVAGRTFLDCVKELETAEGGRLSCSHDGALVLSSHAAAYTPSRTLTLSASTHFTLDGGFGTDNDNLVNDWVGTRPGGTQQAYSADSAIVDEASPQQVNAGTLPLTTDDDVFAIGAWTVNTRSVPVLRFPTVVVHGSKLHAAGFLDDALLLNEGDKVVLTDLPTGSPVSSFTGRVERIEKRFTADDLKFALTLSQWVEVVEFDDPDYGRFAETPGTITLSADITSSATSVVAVTAAGNPPLTNAAGDLPFDISIGGERMTVTAVSAATSPQTLTVTRGVAPTTAAAHTAAAVISIWNPGILGL